MPPTAEAAVRVDELRGLAANRWISQVIYAATELGVADALAAGPRSAAAVAYATGTDPGAVRRLLRALVTVGLVRQAAEGAGDGYELTALGELLRSDPPQSGAPLRGTDAGARGVAGLARAGGLRPHQGHGGAAARRPRRPLRRPGRSRRAGHLRPGHGRGHPPHRRGGGGRLRPLRHRQRRGRA